MNRTTFLILVSFYCCFVSCGDHSSKKQPHFSASHSIDTLGNKKADTTYMYTGYYFLTEVQDGIKMKKENSNEIYSIAKVPFASVNNIVKAELEQTKVNGEIYNELCMTFDAKGTKDLEEGTKNPLHSQLAVVIANKLLYVADNNVKSEIGIMCVALVGYSEQEMQIMRQAIVNKK
jgi:preprotein translocase subunit SecD